MNKRAHKIRDNQIYACLFKCIHYTELILNIASIAHSQFHHIYLISRTEDRGEVKLEARVGEISFLTFSLLYYRLL